MMTFDELWRQNLSPAKAEIDSLDDLRAVDAAVDDVDEEELDRFLERLEKSILSGSADEDSCC